METRSPTSGFTLVEILIALAILSIVMTILYSTFSASSVTARVVEERADELASLVGALDTLGLEVRGAFDQFTGTKGEITFTVMTPLRRDDVPTIQRVSYAFGERGLVRKSLQSADVKTPPGATAEAGRVFTLLEDVAGGASFSFFDGRKWLDEWTTPDKLPAGVKVSLSYRRTQVETVIPVWRGTGK